MTTAETIQLVAVCFTGISVLGGMVKLYLSIRDAGERRAKAILEKMDANIEEMKRHSDVQVQKLNGMLTYVIHSFDRPAWLKVARMRGDGEIEFRMMEMNEQYASTYGIPRHEYLGKTDLEAGWDKRTADAFRAHDLSVWASGEPSTFVESVGGKPMRFRKLRVVSPMNHELKGIFGYAVDCQEPNSCPVYCNPRHS